MSSPGFFRSRLEPMIDLQHPLAMLSARLPWATRVRHFRANLGVQFHIDQALRSGFAKFL